MVITSGRKMLPFVVLALSLVAFSGAVKDDRETTNYKFQLYTRTNPNPYYLNIKNGSTLVRSSYNPAKPTKFVSLTPMQDQKFVGEMVQALLYSNDVNVIVLEARQQSQPQEFYGHQPDQQNRHHRHHYNHQQQEQEQQNQLRQQDQQLNLPQQPDQMQQQQQQQQPQGQLNKVKLSTVGVHNIPFPALSIYRLLTKLVGYGANPQQFHFIVYDDSAHMAAIAAKLLHPHRIGRITALSPRKYENCHAYLTLASTDAEFVDIIWTNLSPSEMSPFSADAIFLPNDGTHPQLGVEQSHRDESSLRSVIYYAESIRRPTAFLAKKIVDGKPSETETNRMGEYAEPAYKSQFYLPTKAEYPYGYEDGESWP